MPINVATGKTRVEPNQVYLIPPDTPMKIADSVLALAPRSEKRKATRPTDYFFRSLASDRKALGIGVVVSPADARDVPGLQAIRDEGGIAIVLSESRAESSLIPPDPVASGVADLALSLEEIGDVLERIGRLPAVTGKELPDRVLEPLDRIIELLKECTGIDFHAYKRGTIHRRIMRRMTLRHYENLDGYLAFLKANEGETALLGDDLLIHVTSFFRDEDTFAALAEQVIPQLFKDHPPGLPFRVWVPGCSTGQEVYSVAMCLLEAMPTRGDQFPLQIFGTDLSEASIGIARAGIYSEAEVSRLSPERRRRFFIRCDGGFQIGKSIREMCVFARHNILSDPPFSRLNLISCRNLLIYLEPATQRHVVATFHYALQPEGCLLLGQSESLREFSELFRQIDRQRRFYGKVSRPETGLRLVRRGFAEDLRLLPARAPVTALARHPEVEMERTAERIVLSEYGPPWILVDENLDVVNSRGDLGPYVQLAPGRATLNLLRMTCDEVRAELSSLLQRARDGETPVRSSFLHREKGVIRSSDLEIRRIPGATPASGACYLIVFFPGNTPGVPALAFSPESEVPAAKAETGAIEVLRQELTLANQRLQAILIERDGAHEELISANEEIQSSNEELQSINEELETSKEELQSANEELNTLNDELRNRNRELGQLSDDLANLLSSTTIPLLTVDNDLRIRRITPAAERLFSVRQADIGRPIGDIRFRLGAEDLDALIRRVIDSLAGEEVELPDRENRWYVLRVRPYRTGDNRIEGAVLSLLDIDRMRRAQTAADLARDFAESVVESVEMPLLVLNGEMKVRVANHAFLAAYGLKSEGVLGRPLDEISEAHWNLPGFRLALERIYRDDSSSEEMEFVQDLPGTYKRTVLINARRIFPRGEHRILIAIRDVTAQRRAERQSASALHESEDALRLSRHELRALTGNLLHAQDEERRRVSRELHDDVSQNVVKLQFDIEALEQTLPPGSEKEKLLALRDGAARLSGDLRRIAYALHPSMLDHLGLTAALSSYAYEFSGRTGIPVEFAAKGVPGELPPAIASSFYRITQEALRNVVRHSGRAAAIRLSGEDLRLTLEIHDTGPGFDREAVRGKGGLGLVSMEERARLIQASFQLTTGPGKGVSIIVSAPLDSGL